MNFLSIASAALAVALVSSSAFADGTQPGSADRHPAVKPQALRQAAAAGGIHNPVRHRVFARRHHPRHATHAHRISAGPRFVTFETGSGYQAAEPQRQVRFASAEAAFRQPRGPRMVYFDPPYYHFPGRR